MVKLIYTYWGAGIALGISGTREQVEQTANRLYNFGATDSDPNWQSEKPEQAFAYVLTDWDRLKKGYADMFIAEAQANPATSAKFKGKKSGYMVIANEHAAKLVAAITPENFLDGQEAQMSIYQMPLTPTPSFD